MSDDTIDPKEFNQPLVDAIAEYEAINVRLMAIVKLTHGQSEAAVNAAQIIAGEIMRLKARIAENEWALTLSRGIDVDISPEEFAHMWSKAKGRGDD